MTKLHYEHLFASQVLACRFDDEDDSVCLLPFSGEVMLTPSNQLEAGLCSLSIPGNELGKRLEHLGIDIRDQ